MVIVLIVGGLAFMGMGVVGVVAHHMSRRSRGMAEALGTKTYPSVLVMLAGALIAAGGVLGQWWVLVAGMAMLGVAAVVTHRSMIEMTDPPPMVARVREQSLNPLTVLRHPVRELKAFAELFRFRRNQRDHRAWEIRRGLRPPDPHG